ncbi:MAG: aldolase [Alphaproteobacteria bacterium]|nr:aldolase [Alphaproteobacteria bacterium]
MRRNDIWQARVDLAAACRWAHRLGWQAGVCNHFSMMVPGSDDLFLVNPEGLYWAEVTASNLVVCDLGGKAVEGQHKVEDTAFYLHAPVHRANKKHKCVLHTHMPYATALCLIENGRIEAVNQSALAYIDRTAYDEDYSGLALSYDEGLRVARLMGDHTTVMMRNHGPLVAGETVAEAFDRLYFLEDVCRVQLIAMQAGRPMKRVAQPMIEAVRGVMESGIGYADKHLAGIKRMLDRLEPDYKN